MAAIKGEETLEASCIRQGELIESNTMIDRGCRLPVEPNKSRCQRSAGAACITILVWPVMAIMRRIDELHVDHSFEGS